MSSSEAPLTWEQLVVLDLATEDEYWLNEVAGEPSLLCD